MSDYSSQEDTKTTETMVLAESRGERRVGIERKVVDEQLKKEEEHWIKSYWRPVMAWLYMLICLMDFVIFPIMAMIQPVFLKHFGITMAYLPWQSLTLNNGGLIHLAFGAILGVTAWTRGQFQISRAPTNAG